MVLPARSSARHVRSLVFPFSFSSSSKGTENMCCDISKDGKWIACGDSGGTVDIYLAESGKLLYRLHDPQFQHLPVTSVKFKNDDPITNLLLASCKPIKYHPSFLMWNVYGYLSC